MWVILKCKYRYKKFHEEIEIIAKLIKNRSRNYVLTRNETDALNGIKIFFSTTPNEYQKIHQLYKKS